MYILGEFGNLIAGDPRSRCVRHTLVACYMYMFFLDCFNELCSNEGPDSLHLCQVYQPVPQDQATDPADPVLGQSVSQWEPGATAEGYRVSTANYHSHS